MHTSAKFKGRAQKNVERVRVPMLLLLTAGFVSNEIWGASLHRAFEMRTNRPCRRQQNRYYWLLKRPMITLKTPFSNYLCAQYLQRPVTVLTEKLVQLITDRQVILWQTLLKQLLCFFWVLCLKAFIMDNRIAHWKSTEFSRRKLLVQFNV